MLGPRAGKKESSGLRGCRTHDRHSAGSIWARSGSESIGSSAAAHRLRHQHQNNQSEGNSLTTTVGHHQRVHAPPHPALPLHTHHPA